MRMWDTELQNLVSRPGLQEDSPTKKWAESLHYELDVTKDSEWILVYSSQKAQSSLLYVQEAGEFHARQNYYTRRRGVDSFLIKIVLNGEGTLEYEGEKYRCQAGDFFWIDCQKPHYYATALGAGEWHVVWMHFFGGEARRYYEQYLEANQGSPVGSLQEPGKIARLIREMIAQYVVVRNDYVTDIRMSSVVTQILAECLAETVHRVMVRQNKQPPKRIQEVYAYITEHFTERFTLDDLASRFYLNKFYLQKQFRQSIGKTPNEYQNELRVDLAKEMLRMTTISVADIALRLGFENVSYFIQLFKKREGMTPLQYRNSWIS